MALHLFFGEECQSFLLELPPARTKGMAPKRPNSRMYFSRAGIPMPFCEVIIQSTTNNTTMATTINAVFANLLITHSALNPVSGASFNVLFSAAKIPPLRATYLHDGEIISVPRPKLEGTVRQLCSQKSKGWWTYYEKTHNQVAIREGV